MMTAIGKKRKNGKCMLSNALNMRLTRQVKANGKMTFNKMQIRTHGMTNVMAVNFSPKAGKKKSKIPTQMTAIAVIPAIAK